MIVLDTNVVSELMRVEVAPEVREWFAARNPNELWLTVLTIAEVNFGIALLPDGKRKAAYTEQFEQIVSVEFGGRTLDFTATSAVHYSRIAAHRRQSGRPMQPSDAQIAAICFDARYRLATRNIRDFEDCGIELINPWSP